ncbi:glycosyltransferase family 2 protein, partial [Enterococcus faecium]
PDYLELLYFGTLTYGADISVLKIKKISSLVQLKEQTIAERKWEIFDREQAMKNIFINNKIG